MKQLLWLASMGLLVTSIYTEDHSPNSTSTRPIYLALKTVKTSSTFISTTTREPHPDFEYYGSTGYKLYLKREDWNTARYTCEEQGAHLAVIYNQTEYEILQSLFAKAPAIKTDYRNIYAFVGIHDRFEEGKWLTLFDESIDKEAYHEWDTVENIQQPDNGKGKQGGEQDCGALVKNGQLADMWCDRKLPFFCKHQVGSSTHVYKSLK